MNQFLAALSVAAFIVALTYLATVQWARPDTDDQEQP